MGIKSDRLDITLEELPNYLRANHSVYAEIDGKLLYLTDANDIYWRAQCTKTLNEKGHYTDCTTLVPVVSEFMELPLIDDKSLSKNFDEFVFYASVKE